MSVVVVDGDEPAQVIELGVLGPQGVPGSDAAITEANVEAVIGPRNGISGYLGLDVEGTIPDIRIPASIARDTEVSAQVAALVAAAPDALDTLNELSVALGNDPNFAATVNNAIAARATQVALDAVQLAAPARSYRPASIVYLGDSVTARGGQFDTGLRSLSGYTTWTQVLTGERLTPLFNAGVPGEGIAGPAARLQADVIDRAPGVCVILIGINDIKGTPATSLATMQATMTSMLDQLRTAGILAVVCTIPPSDLLDTVAEKTQWHAWNRWLLGLGSRSGVRVCNIAPHVTDPAATIWGAGLSDDGTHENATGALAMAIPLAAVLSAIYPPLSVIGAGIGDVDEKMPNPNMTGNNAGAATGVAIIGGVLAKVARTDGRLGEWQQWTTAVSTVGTFLEDALAATTGLVPGDKVRGEIEYETDAAWAGVTSFFVGIEDRTSANAVAGYQYDFGPVAIPAWPKSGVFKTNPFTLVNGYRVRLMVRIATGAGSSAVIRIGRMSLRKV
jgi:lysophospholipase L1-like esterase